MKRIILSLICALAPLAGYSDPWGNQESFALFLIISVFAASSTILTVIFFACFKLFRSVGRTFLKLYLYTTYVAASFLVLYYALIIFNISSVNIATREIVSFVVKLFAIVLVYLQIKMIKKNLRATDAS